MAVCTPTTIAVCIPMKNHSLNQNGYGPLGSFLGMRRRRKKHMHKTRMRRRRDKKPKYAAAPRLQFKFEGHRWEKIKREQTRACHAVQYAQWTIGNAQYAHELICKGFVMHLPNQGRSTRQGCYVHALGHVPPSSWKHKINLRFVYVVGKQT